MTDPRKLLAIPADVVITPVADLSADVRRRLDAPPGACALTRLGTRVPTKVVDADGASLLREFNPPKRLIEAVLSYSLARQLDPQATLRAALPLLRDLVSSKLLVEPASAAEAAVTPSLTQGEAWGGHRIVRCLRVLEDTEVYELADRDGRRMALKIQRPEEGLATQAMLSREAAVLRRLNGPPGPQLLSEGSAANRSYLVLEWIAGTDAGTAAFHCREGADQAGLLDLCEHILRAYTALHSRGVVHGDVHPSNIVVGPDGSVVILDYGWSIDTDAAAAERLPRAGVAEFFEPEYARALLAGKAPPAASVMSDQYGVAVMLYRLLTGQDYLRFSLDERRVLTQIARDPPVAFAAQGVSPWPAGERLLLRALAKYPQDRFASLADFMHAFTRARLPPSIRPSRRGRSSASSLTSLTLRRLRPEGPLLSASERSAPFSSLYYGMAGTAWGLHRMACVREDPQVLAHAAFWAERCGVAARRRGAFLSSRLDLTAKLVGRASLYHGRPGLHYLAAVLADTIGDRPARDRALGRWLKLTRRGSPEVELSLGRAGALLTAGFALELIGDQSPACRRRLLAAGQHHHLALCRRMRHPVTKTNAGSAMNLGVAHGWAGVLYAILRWEALTGAGRPAWIDARLDELSASAVVDRTGAYWPWPASGHRGRARPPHMPGWCNGSAGMVGLWTLANRITGEGSFLRMAELAALNAWASDPGEAHLCCGLAGIAYGLLNLYRHSGEPQWLNRATALADRAAERALDASRGAPGEFAHSLFRGDVGLAVLLVDLECPANAAFPLFEAGR